MTEQKYEDMDFDSVRQATNLNLAALALSHTSTGFPTGDELYVSEIKFLASFRQSLSMTDYMIYTWSSFKSWSRYQFRFYRIIRERTYQFSLTGTIAAGTLNAISLCADHEVSLGKSHVFLRQRIEVLLFEDSPLTAL